MRTPAGSAAAATPTSAGQEGDEQHECAAPIHFGAAGRLFGWYHAPHGAAQRDCAVVLCPPLGYEELCAHRALRHWAAALAAAGIATLRFDYDGTGNSAGSDADPDRVPAWIGSIVEAAAELRTRSGVATVVLAGVRLGGTLAMAAAERVGADALLLFAAHLTGRAYSREVRALARLTAAGDEHPREEPAADPGEQAAGFVLTAATMSALSQLDPLARPPSARRAFVVARDDVAPDSRLADRLVAAGVVVERAVLAGYARMMVDAHESVAPWDVIHGSLRWLTSLYGARSAADNDRHRHGATRPGATTNARVDARTDEARGTDASATVRESAVIFHTKPRLFGVLSEAVCPPDGPRTGVVLVNAGSVHTVGPGRLYVALARDWSSLGFPVLRIDIGGVGDSETPSDGADNHPYPHHAVRDVDAAARWLRTHAGVERVIVAGVCSGAHASFHAGLALDDIDGIIVINPIVFYWNPACALDVSTWMNYYESRRYTQAARQMGSWLRLLRGRVNMRQVVRVWYGRMRDVVTSRAAALWRSLAPGARGREDVGLDLERITARGVDVLLVFSDGDPGLDFIRRRHARDIHRLERRSPSFAMRIIPRADHTFTRLEAGTRLREMLTLHLVQRARQESRAVPQ